METEMLISAAAALSFAALAITWILAPTTPVEVIAAAKVAMPEAAL